MKVRNGGKVYGLPFLLLLVVAKAVCMLCFAAWNNGFGLGLYFVSEALKAMNIKIEVESEVCKGSNFALIISNRTVVSNNK